MEAPEITVMLVDLVVGLAMELAGTGIPLQLRPVKEITVDPVMAVRRNMVALVAAALARLGEQEPGQLEALAATGLHQLFLGLLFTTEAEALEEQTEDLILLPH